MGSFGEASDKPLEADQTCHTLPPQSRAPSLPHHGPGCISPCSGRDLDHPVQNTARNRSHTEVTYMSKSQNQNLQWNCSINVM